MLAQEIFNQQLTINSEVLDAWQEVVAFSRSCDTFFGVVSLIYNVTAISEPVLGDYAGDDLGIGFSGYTVNRVLSLGVDKYLIKVKPLSYDNVPIKIEWREDFRMCCDFVILTSSQSNIDLLRGIGVETAEMKNMQYSEVKDYLERKYCTEFSDLYS